MPVPIPENKIPLSFVGTFSPVEFEKIKEGFKSRGMEDKWRITFEEPWLYFRRSWTGRYIYGARFFQKGRDYAVVESWSNGDRAQFKSTGAQHDEAMLKYLIENFLLGKSVPFPLPPNLPAEHAGLYQWHVMGDGTPRPK